MADDYIGEMKPDQFKNTKELLKFLSRELAKSGYVNIVEDELLKDTCLHSASNGYSRAPVYDDVFKPIIATGASSSDMESAMASAISDLKGKASKAGANYVFTKTTLNNSINIRSICHNGYGGRSDAYETKSDDIFSVSIIATPYSIIGEKELETLKTVYASGAPYEVSKAVKKFFSASLEHDFADLYRTNPREFQSMFAMLNQGKRIEVIKKIQGIEKRNPETDEWLSSRYAKEVEDSLVGGIADSKEEGA